MPDKKYYWKHRERLLKERKEYWAENKEKEMENRKEWRKNNKERDQEIRRKSEKKSRKNPAWLKRKSEWAKNKYDTDSTFKLNACISSAVRISLKGDKAGRSWEILLGFTITDLKTHLENQFSGDMTWENYGSYWHVDHNKPLSWFENPIDSWTLENLQPMIAFDNQSKNNRFTEVNGERIMRVNI